ncbi:MAG: substrate-binding domain-containing protein, partial [Burkholderiales bacterium]|nr:substrate-binding domain-containing protein [Burkholderiales bacterium]
KHLLRQGRSRVAFFGDICQAGVHQIYQGYMLAHSQAGFSADPSLLCPVAARQVLIAETLSRLTRAEPAFDAIVAASDFHAMLVIRSLISLGFSIPEQIAVTGYGDTYCADFFYPALTSINFSLESAAKQLLDCLFDQMNGQESRSTLLPARLKIRDSSMSS